MSVASLRLSAAIAVLVGFQTPASSTSDESGWRLRYVDLQITPQLANRSLRGRVRLSLQPPRADTIPLVLDLADSMVVDSVLGSGELSPIAYVREPHTIRIRAPRSSWCPARAVRSDSVRCDITISYHGIPSRSAFGMLDRGGTLRGGSYGVPNSAREWWPTLDRPTQKADSADISITVPGGIVAVSNGTLRDRTINADGTATFHWTERYPIYSDVISVAVADYVERRSSFRSMTGQSVALRFFAFPEDSAKADADFAIVPSVLSFLESRLGPYPFAREKYGIAEFARPSFREHQTIPSLGASLITGTSANAQVIAHEAAHQWFGNSLTIAGWRDIWLNESFAEYFAWQWVRTTKGDSAFDALWKGAAEQRYALPLSRADSGGFASMFGGLTFQKGPLVLLMLEDLIGSKAMTDAMRSYTARNAYGHASLAEFRVAAERASHKKLTWFFDQWTTRAETPEISLAWSYEPASGHAGRLHATITQIGTSAPFRLPLTLQITSASGTTKAVPAEVRRSREEFLIPVDGPPSNVAVSTKRMLLRVSEQPASTSGDALRRPTP